MIKRTMPRPKKIKNQSSLSPKIEGLVNKDESILKELSLQISELSYEESLEQLDDILGKLQSETLFAEDLKISYLQASLYLDHCEKLLNTIEQEVVEIDTDEDSLVKGS